MDRIVLIGNGFDLAHGLKTGYNDLQSWLKTHASSSYRFMNEYSSGNEIGGGIFSEGINFPRRKYYPLIFEGIADPWLIVNEYGNLNYHSERNSIYFKHLCEEGEDTIFWKDLESLYFDLLIEHKNSADSIHLINEEFEHLKNLLQKYLISLGEGVIAKRGIANLLFEEPQYVFSTRPWDQVSFITFNYTHTLNTYLNSDNYKIGYQGRTTSGPNYLDPIYIHGKLSDPESPIIFGYGDEDSEDYKKLELIGKDELLKNFKTFQYLRSNNYHQVLGLLENPHKQPASEGIYVQIVGHSYGLCDKALLRTIFQHENVKYIEAVYYKDEAQYFKNLYNISRIFDDNTLMRKKVLPLEQTRRID